MFFPQVKKKVSMRYVRLFSVFFQHVSEQRARSLVWFILSIFSPVLMILFWRGAKTDAAQWSFSNVTSYYLLLVIAGSLLMSHIEDDVAVLDIQEGGLAAYLLKPFNYYWIKFYSELPWRIFQGIFGIISFFVITFLFHITVAISLSPMTIATTFLMAFFGYFISFTYKMVLGLLAFWFTDISGMYQLSEMLIFIFAGYIVPIRLYPDILATIAYLLPFPYILYYPTIALQGILTQWEIIRVIGIQCAWLIGLTLTYMILWKKGIKIFTGVGQ